MVDSWVWKLDSSASLYFFHNAWSFLMLSSPVLMVGMDWVVVVVWFNPVESSSHVLWAVGVGTVVKSASLKVQTNLGRLAFQAGGW
jgi:hypothetical protein